MDNLDFFLIQGETLADIKVRLRDRLGMNEKDFLEVKIAIVPATSYAKPEYLEEDGKSIRMFHPIV